MPHQSGMLSCCTSGCLWHHQHNLCHRILVQGHCTGVYESGHHHHMWECRYPMVTRVPSYHWLRGRRRKHDQFLSLLCTSQTCNLGANIRWWDLLGQGDFWHFSVCRPSPSHSLPPSWGVGELQRRIRVITPAPQVTEQDDQGDQWLQLPSCLTEGRKERSEVGYQEAKH